MNKITLSARTIFFAVATIVMATVLYFVISVFAKRDKEVFVPSDDAATQTHGTDAATDHGDASTSTDTSADVVAPPSSASDTAPQTPPDNSVTEPTAPAPASAHIHVTPPDCARECATYRHDEREFTYCKNVCGIADDVSSSNCDTLSGLKKDYCLKNRAVAAKDLSACDAIRDGGIKQACRNRLQEDFVENL